MIIFGKETSEKFSEIKKSTIFPNNHSDDKIIKSIENIGNITPIGIRSDGYNPHRVAIDGVRIQL